MTAKELILDQFDACFNSENWFIPLTKSLEDITPDQAKWKDGNSNHSIIQLVRHLIFWNERYLMRFIGEPLPPVNIGGEDPTFDLNPSDWESELKKLNNVFSDFRIAIENATDEKLQSLSGKDREDNWYTVLSNINIHNAYHIGQIIFIRKLQGSWK